MSVRSTAPEAQATDSYTTTYDADRGFGWMLFAGVLLIIVGTINFIEGVAAIDNARFFVANTQYVFGNLNAWGWTVLCIGVVQWVVGLGVFARNQLAQWTGVAIFSLNAITQLLMMPAYPFWSLCIFAIDILGVYGLIAYGKWLEA